MRRSVPACDPEGMYELPVGNEDGSTLLTFERMADGELRGLDPSVPLTASLVALWCDGRCLMVFNRFRRGAPSTSRPESFRSTLP